MFRDDVKIAAQDVGLFGNGAYTGEQSAEMLMDSGIKWTLTGHSERRTGFGYTGETSEVVAKKTKGAVDQGMNVIVCIGEQLSDREAGITMTVLASMLEPCVDAMTENDWNKSVIAYEPVWAIGTGKVATPEQAEETHAEIRAYIAEKVSIEVAKKIRIIYGGSVKGSNCSTLIKCDNIDGFLVGGASLKPEFVDIINCTKFRM
jgi:triosephosphate isomerase